MGVGLQRLQEQIHKKVAMVVLRDLHDPRVRLVTITKVHLTRDLSLCKVYWSSLEEGGARSAIAHALADASGFVQREVAKILETRIVPKIEFVFDPSIEGVERLSRILRDARQEDEQRASTRPPAAEDADDAGEERAAAGGSEEDDEEVADDEEDASDPSLKDPRR
jgi:ribosome-binding factor A